MDDQIDSLGRSCPDSSAKVNQCIGFLLDDYARQGSFLGIDDVNRVISRRQLKPVESLAVWQGLAKTGIIVDGLKKGATADEKVSTSNDSPRSETWPGSYGGHRILPHEQQIQLARRMRAGLAAEQAAIGNDSDIDANDIIQAGKVARAQLILSNIRLVFHCAIYHSKRTTIPIDDLVQEGILGLSRAADLFDPERGFRFSTYATWWINQHIYRAIDNTGRTIRIPSHTLQNLRSLQRKRKRLASSLRRSVTAKDLAHELGCDVAEVELLLRIETDAQSLSHEAGTSDEIKVREGSRSGIESPERIIVRKELESIIEGVLHTLDERSRDILICRFGLNGKRRLTLKQLGRKFGITRERVRQIQSRALRKIAQGRRGAMLRSYIEDDEN